MKFPPNTINAKFYISKIITRREKIEKYKIKLQKISDFEKFRSNRQLNAELQFVPNLATF